MYLVRQKGLGLPQESREAFALLEKANILPTELTGRLQRMVGFRNVAIHEYTRPNLDIVRTIITKQLKDFRQFFSTIVKACGQRRSRRVGTNQTLMRLCHWG
jgi:uncharacterized protein YutE (UPF0331/DUF86 family)